MASMRRGALVASIFVGGALFYRAQARSATARAERELDAVATALAGWQISPDGTLGYAKAEVTLGGIDTAALSSKTMAAKDVPGLFVIGEAVDVTGWLGGYNFQWAWATGYLAGRGAVAELGKGSEKRP